MIARSPRGTWLSRPRQDAPAVMMPIPTHLPSFHKRRSLAYIGTLSPFL